VVDEQTEPFERRLADRLGRLKREAAAEDGQAAQIGLRCVVEERVAPLERRGKRLLARRQVARAAGEQWQARLQPLQ
jgi:hypothetical protein